MAKQENTRAAGAAVCAGFSAKGREPVLTEGFCGEKKQKNISLSQKDVFLAETYVALP